ncbi:MAG: hypothetical protein PHT69_04190 [Bacteroidales bacterium]|nr:hypothetical protein [Bacteroidales bacterium]
MKKSGKVWGATFLTIIYCFAIGFVVNSHTVSDIQVNFNTEYADFLSTISTKISSPDSQSESTVNNFNNLPVPGIKIQWNELWTLCETYGHLFKRKYSQYTFLYRNFYIGFCKTNIIFPFHYFW